MAKYRVISKGSLITIKCRLSKKEQINEREILYLAKNYTRGLFKIYYDGKKTIEYTTPMSVPLEKYLKNTILQEDIFWKIIAQIVETVKTVEICGLHPDGLWMDLQTIFINEKTGELYFVYRPFTQIEAVFNPLAVIKDITYMEAKKGAGMSAGYAAQFQNFLDQGGNFHLELIGYYIEKTHPEVYAKVGRAELGRSGYLTANILNYQKHYEESDRQRKTVQLETECLQEGETTLLMQEDAGDTVLLTEMSCAVLRRKNTGEQIQIEKGEFCLGKGSGSDYIIKDNTAVSRKHALIKRKDTFFYIIDLHSTNGTFLNGRRLLEGEEALLEDKDEITLADEGFAIEIR